MKVVLLSCVKSKLPHRARVEDLYTSALFKGSLKYARLMGADVIFVLSAKHGLLALDEVIEPYEETLLTKSVKERKEWTARVVRQLACKTNLQADHFVVLAGEAYRKYLLPSLRSYEVPLAGKSMGPQLAFYSTLPK